MELGRCVTTWKGVNGMPEGLCRREGKVGDIFSLFISIARCNQIHISIVPWNNELVIVQ